MKNVEDVYPLSPMQNGMMFHTLYAPGSGAYVVHISSRIDGNFSVAHFKRAWQTILDRHPILRSAYLWEKVESPLQVVRKELQFTWDERDWREMPAAEQEKQIQEYLWSEHYRGFDLAQAPLIRMALIRLGESSYQFVWNYSHLLLDGWSVNIIFGELFQFYKAYANGQELDLPRPRPYRDFIAWMQQQDKRKAEAFWRKTLKGFTAPTQIGFDEGKGGPENDLHPEYFELACDLGTEITAKLQSISRQQRFTVSTFFQAVWAWLLARYSGNEEVLFGVTVTGRPVSLKGVNGVVGLLVNTLPMRIRIDRDASVLDWLKVVHDHQVEIREYEYSPLVEVKSWSEIQGAQPLFETFFVFENHPVVTGVQELSQGAQFRASRVFESSAYPITIIAEPHENICVRVLFDKSRLSSENATRILEHFKTLLSQITENPDRKVSDLSLFPVAAGQLRARLPVAEAEDIETIHALSPAQEEMLARDQAADSLLCFGQCVFTLRSEIDAGNFQAAWRKTAGLNDALRSSIHWEGLEQPVRAVHRGADLPVEWQDWRSLTEEEMETRLPKLMASECAEGFQLASAPLARLTCVRTGENKYLVIVSYHPLVLDDRSVRALMETALSHHGAARDGGELALAAPVSDQEDASFAAGGQMEDLEFWRGEFSEFSSASLLASALPVSGPREREISLSRRYAPPELAARLRDVAASSGAGLTAVLLGAWAVLLSRYTGQDDVVFGIVSDGRQDDTNGAGAIGPFAAVLPLRLRVSGDDLLMPWLRLVEERRFAAVRHQSLPLKRIQECAHWEDGAPFFDHVVSIFNDFPERTDAAGMAGVSKAVEFGPGLTFHGKFPLTMAVQTGPGGILLQCAYSRSEFDMPAVEDLLEHYRQLLKEIAGEDEQTVSESCETGAVAVSA